MECTAAQSHLLRVPVLSEGRWSGDCHEVVAIHSRNFRRHALRRTTRRGPKLSVVCLWKFWGRRHELRVFNVSTMLGRPDREQRLVWGQSAVPAFAGSAAKPLSLL